MTRYFEDGSIRDLEDAVDRLLESGAAAPATDQTFTDDFNRANGAVGSNWKTLPGVPIAPVISGNHVIPSATNDNNAIAVVNAYGVNQWARIASSLGANYSEAGVLLHASDGDHVMMFVYTTDGEPYGPGIFGSVDGPAIQSYFLTGPGPVFRFLGQVAAPGTGTHVIFGCNVGRQIQYWFDGVLAFNVDDSAHTELALTVPNLGFTVHRAGTGLETIADDFAGGDWVTAPAVPTITSLPGSVDVLGGAVAVNGTAFIKDATMATISGTNYPVTVTSPTSGIFTAPAHAAGNVTVTITSVGGTSAGATLTYASNVRSGSAAVAWNVATAAVGKKAPTATSTTLWNDAIAAVGKRSPKAVLTTLWDVATLAVGKRAPKATSTTLWNVTTLAAGKRTPVATTTTLWNESVTAAVGKRSPKAATTTIHTWVTAAQGVMPIVGAKQGNATVLWSSNVLATGKRAPKAQSSTTWNDAITVTGKRIAGGVAAVSWVDVLAGVGKRVPKAVSITTHLWTLLSSGKRSPKATGATTHAWALTAQGVMPSVGVRQGSALVSHTWTTAAVGSRPAKGGNAVTYSFNVLAAGKKITKGVASTAWNVATTAAGKRFPKATVAVAWNVALTAAGYRASRGSTSTAYNWATTANGVKPIVGFKQGFATVTNTWTATAVGKRSPKATAPVTVTWAVGASGKKIQKGTTSLVHTWALSPFGKKVPKGTVLVVYAENVNAVGKRVPKSAAIVTYRYTVVVLGLSGITGFVEAIWNDQEVVEMMYGDKPVVQWLLVPS
jgi:hypothetical protein